MTCIIANVKAYASNLHSAGDELERQHQLITQRAEAKVQERMHDASLQYQAIEKLALDPIPIHCGERRERLPQPVGTVENPAVHCGERSPPPQRGIN